MTDVNPITETPAVDDDGPTVDTTGSALPPLCTTTDVEGRLMRAFTDAETTAVTLFLSDASALIRRWCRQSFTLEQTTDVIRLRSDGQLVLPRQPVQSVDQVWIINVDGSTTPIGNWWFDGIDTVRPWLDGWPIVNAPAIWWDQQNDTVKVAYTAGWPEVPPEVVGVCAAVALRRLTEPPAHQRTVKVGEVEQMYYDPQSPGSVYLTPDDKLALNDFRPSAQSIRLA